MSRPVDYAQSLLARYWDRTIPIDPKQLIDNIDDLQVVSENLPDNISGRINYDFNKNSYIITVNENHHPNRQRFTIAHELGHYVLGHGSKEDVLYRNGDSDPDEIEANAFAAEILMPQGVIRHLIFEQDITDIRILAKKLWVSDDAMYYRLRNLGLI